MELGSQPQVEVELTRDGSATLYTARFNQHYHSIHGAIQESQHVFIEAGLSSIEDPAGKLRILEMGMGTGLNVLLTSLAEKKYVIEYHALEAYPLAEAQWLSLNYQERLDEAEAALQFEAIHQGPWEEAFEVRPSFSLSKFAQRLEEYEPKVRYHVVYWDAFAPEAQPELWTEAVWERVFSWLEPGGIWVSYCAKGAVRRGLQSAGFTVERLPGPPGKREMLRARKPVVSE
ncbi:MAG: tRNA (5-methylaminomethyl-2-thiouridine)(34)-methyltransferase MnmD [Bacteroidota bacterium]